MKKIKRPKFECHLKIQKNESFKKNFGGKFLFRGFKKLCLLKFLMKKNFLAILDVNLEGPLLQARLCGQAEEKVSGSIPGSNDALLWVSEIVGKNIPSIISCVWAASVHTHTDKLTVAQLPPPPSPRLSLNSSPLHKPPKSILAFVAYVSTFHGPAIHL